MKKTYKFALKTSLFLTFFIGILSTLLMFKYQKVFDLNFILFLIIPFFLFSFLFIQYRVENFIYNRIKSIVRKISVIDIKDVDQGKITTDLEGLSGELEEIAEKNRLEIISLNKQEAYRREFLGNVAHEMKTPIFTIQGYLITLLEGAGNDKELRNKYLERAVKGVERLEAVVKDLDMIAKLETRDIHPDIENFNLVSLIQNVFDILEMKSQKKGNHLRFDQYYEFPIMVSADPEKIEQVLINLLENSIKYGNKNGFSEVQIDESDPSKIMVSISDDGEGMDKSQLSRIFERFYRVEKSRSRDQGGSGLGLAIVKHILEAHKQTISVKSEVGQGTTFTFTLNKAI